MLKHARPEHHHRRQVHPRCDIQPVVDVSVVLAGPHFPSEILLQLAELYDNPIKMLVSLAHLSKSFCRAAWDAQALLKHVKLQPWNLTVDDAAVAAVATRCVQLIELDVAWCTQITNETVVGLALHHPQLTTLNLCGCKKITDAAVVVLASRCTRLSNLHLHFGS